MPRLALSRLRDEVPVEPEMWNGREEELDEPWMVSKDELISVQSLGGLVAMVVVKQGIAQHSLVKSILTSQAHTCNHRVECGVQKRKAEPIDVEEEGSKT